MRSARLLRFTRFRRRSTAPRPPRGSVGPLAPSALRASVPSGPTDPPEPSSPSATPPAPQTDHAGGHRLRPEAPPRTLPGQPTASTPQGGAFSLPKSGTFSAPVDTSPKSVRFSDPISVHFSRPIDIRHRISSVSASGPLSPPRPVQQPTRPAGAPKPPPRHQGKSALITIRRDATPPAMAPQVPRRSTGAKSVALYLALIQAARSRPAENRQTLTGCPLPFPHHAEPPRTRVGGDPVRPEASTRHRPTAWPAVAFPESPVGAQDNSNNRSHAGSVSVIAPSSARPMPADPLRNEASSTNPCPPLTSAQARKPPMPTPGL